MQPEEIIMFFRNLSLGLILLGPTDGSEAWGGGPMPWGMLEGPEIKAAAEAAAKDGDAETAETLRVINDHAMTMETALRDQ